MATQGFEQWKGHGSPACRLLPLLTKVRGSISCTAFGALSGLVILGLLSIMGCGGPIPAGKGATILDPQITLTFNRVTLYCDGTFDAYIDANAVYPAPPPAPAKSTLGTAKVNNPQVSQSNNVQNPQFSGLPLTFQNNGKQTFEVTGNLTSLCDQGTFSVVTGVAYELGRNGTASGGPFTVGPVPITGHGPNPDPKAKAPNGDFSFVDTLHCCKMGNVMLTPVAGSNVNPGLTVNPNMIACAAGPTPDESVTLKGQLTVPENNGNARLQATDGASTCTVKTTVDHP